MKYYYVQVTPDVYRHVQADDIIIGPGVQFLSQGQIVAYFADLLYFYEMKEAPVAS